MNDKTYDAVVKMLKDHIERLTEELINMQSVITEYGIKYGKLEDEDV